MPVVTWPGAESEAIALGRRIVPLGAPVRLHLPGACVWDGWDHAFAKAFGVWFPTRTAWALGTEKMVALVESETFDAIAGVDERESFDPMPFLEAA